MYNLYKIIQIKFQVATKPSLLMEIIFMKIFWVIYLIMLIICYFLQHEIFDDLYQNNFQNSELLTYVIKNRFNNVAEF